MKGKLGTRANIPPSSRMHIIARAIAPPRIPRRELAKKLQNELEGMGHDVPEVEVLERIISKYRNKVTKDPKDEPWSLGSLAEHPILLEALPVVMALNWKRRTEDSELSIREALWIARLYKAFTSLDLVYDWAFLYTLEEMVFEMQGKPFDSSELDLEMMSNPYYASESRKEIFIHEIADKYSADPIKLKNLNLSLEEIEEIVKSNPEEFFTKEKFYLSDYSKEGAKLIDKLNEADKAKLIKSRKEPVKPVKEKKRRKQK